MQRAWWTVHILGLHSHQRHDTLQQLKVFKQIPITWNSDVLLVCALYLICFCQRSKCSQIQFRYLAPKGYLITVHSLCPKFLCSFWSCAETVNKLLCRMMRHSKSSGDVSLLNWVFPWCLTQITRFWHGMRIGVNQLLNIVFIPLYRLGTCLLVSPNLVRVFKLQSCLVAAVSSALFWLVINRLFSAKHFVSSQQYSL